MEARHNIKSLQLDNKDFFKNNAYLFNPNTEDEKKTLNSGVTVDISNTYTRTPPSLAVSYSTCVTGFLPLNFGVCILIFPSWKMQ